MAASSSIGGIHINPLICRPASSLQKLMKLASDGDIDEDVRITFYVDSDGDGFGNEEITLEACSATDGFVSNGGDCDDTDADSYPGATEICDGADNNCDGDIDEGIGDIFSGLFGCVCEAIDALNVVVVIKGMKIFICSI